VQGDCILYTAGCKVDHQYGQLVLGSPKAADCLPAVGRIAPRAYQVVPLRASDRRGAGRADSTRPILHRFGQVQRHPLDRAPLPRGGPDTLVDPQLPRRRPALLLGVEGVLGRGRERLAGDDQVFDSGISVGQHRRDGLPLRGVGGGISGQHLVPDV
jgi:hypothetical protein